MTETTSDHLLERLRQWGVRRVFGYPGDGINGLMGAFDRAGDQMEFIQARHEELAAFMACGHAKFTGELGVCMATSGPGAIHLLNGLYDAKSDHQPVLAIVGQQARSALGGDYQQEVDLHSLFKDVAAEYVQTITVPAQVRHVVDRAVRIAIDQRTVTCIIVPNDVQVLDAMKSPPREHGTVHTGVGTTVRSTLPDEADIAAAAEILNAGKRVAILAGAGALHAAEELIAVADLLGAGVAKALLGKAVLPDDLPFVTGSIGLLGTHPSWQMMSRCDTLLMVGSSFPYSEYLPKEGKARGVQIDLDGRRLSLRYPMEMNLVGDSRATLRALIPHLKRKTRRGWRSDIEESVTKWWGTLEARAMSDAQPINPQRVFWELSPRLPDNCIVTCDSGSTAAWYARDLRFRSGMMGSLSGGLATMGPAVPYAIAAKFAHPQRHVHRHPRRWGDADDRHQLAGHHFRHLAALGQSPADHHGAQQQGPEHGHLGAARARGRPEVRGFSGPAALPVRGVRAHAGPRGHQGDRPCTGRAGLGRGAGGGPADPARDGDRPGRPGAAAQLQHPAGEQLPGVTGASRPGCQRHADRHRQAVVGRDVPAARAVEVRRRWAMHAGIRAVAEGGLVWDRHPRMGG